LEARKHHRFAVQLPVSFHGDQLKNDAQGTILNLSNDGCAITSESIADTAEYLHLTMQLREREDPIAVDLAAVRWTSASRFGVEFIKIRPEEGERLKTFVKKLEAGAPA
jgi:hypothetical protein